MKHLLVKTLTLMILFNLFTACEKDFNPNNETAKNLENNDLKENFVETYGVKGEVTTVKYFDQLIEVEKVGDQYILGGDMIIIPDNEYYANKTNAIKSVGRTTARWGNNTVYYEIESDLPNQYRVHDAIDHWEQNTSIRFYPKTDTTQDYITFRIGTGCSSSVGRVGGRQYINLASGCSTGTTIHEIGHALGLWHEQSRSDQDEYITVHYDNITSGYEHNFRTYIERGTDGKEYTEVFDFGSIMMYPPYAFSKNGEPTITTKDGSANYPYQRDGLSNNDIIGISKMYPPITGVILPTIKNPTFSIKEAPYNGASYTCSCVEWYNPNFPKQAGSSTDSNDDPGNQGGGSIKLTNVPGEQRTAYQLLDAVTPGATYRLRFYYSITNSGTI
ncbi:M12 family metallopeptidase, partial [Flavivirga aquimarina]